MLQKTYDLTCWYLNVKRVAELLGTGVLPIVGRQNSDPLYRVDFNARVKDLILSKLASAKPPTLEELVVKKEAVCGAMFTHTGRVFCRGLTAYSLAVSAGRTPRRLPNMYIKLDDFDPGKRLEFEYHPEHLTSNSAYSHLAGSPNLFLLGLIDDVEGSVISAKPFVIGSVMMNIFDKDHPVLWGNRFELTIDEIDSFKEVRSQEHPTKTDLAVLKGVTEDATKRAFAEIIGEPQIPDDWGGERSDLVSDRLILEGKRISAAFAFKGPAKFSAMKASHLGKNGDQIVRLFSEDAGLLILQHCHEVTQPVRQTMQAFAKNLSNPRRWCVIDGYDTLRLLRAYKPELVAPKGLTAGGATNLDT